MNASIDGSAIDKVLRNAVVRNRDDVTSSRLPPGSALMSVRFVGLE
jgi:hypothetical protein